MVGDFGKLEFQPPCLVKYTPDYAGMPFGGNLVIATYCVPTRRVVHKHLNKPGELAKTAAPPRVVRTRAVVCCLLLSSSVQPYLRAVRARGSHRYTATVRTASRTLFHPDILYAERRQRPSSGR